MMIAICFSELPEGAKFRFDNTYRAALYTKRGGFAQRGNIRIQISPFYVVYVQRGGCLTLLFGR